MAGRIMAHVIVYEGREYPLHIAEMGPDGTIRLYPFECEIHSTRFIEGRVEVSAGKNGEMIIRKPD